MEKNLGKCQPFQEKDCQPFQEIKPTPTPSQKGRETQSI